MLATVFCIVIITWLFKLLYRIAGGALRIVAGCINSARRKRERIAEAERRNAARIEKERAAEVERAARLECMQRRENERREKEKRRENERAEKARIAAEREQERKTAARWRECCYKSKLGLAYQNAVDNESYLRARGTELYSLLELYENELFDATGANDTKRIETARKKLLNTRRLIRENEKAVYKGVFDKNQYKAYCSGAE